MQFDQLKRREFITLLGGAGVWPVVARAQQAAMPVVAFINTGSREMRRERVATFRKGLSEAGYTEGQNVSVEYHWLDGAEAQPDRLPLLVADLLGRKVALIVGNTPSALAAKAATTTVPIVFVTGGDPVSDGLVAGLARPGGNVTGISFIVVELGAKQFALLRELRPGSARTAVLVDPKWLMTERLVSELRTAASAVGQQLIVLYVSSDREIETAFMTLVQRGAGALHAGVGAFLSDQRERIVALAARHGIPAIYNWREAVAAGGLMSYAPSIPDAYRQAGIYAGRILKGENVICRLRCRQNSSWSSTSRPRRRSASKSPTSCSRSPMR